MKNTVAHILLIALLGLLFPALLSAQTTENHIQLELIIQGKGAVRPDQPPPYKKGQTVTLTFYPSGRARFSAKPDAPTAPSDDPLAGWVFDHWSLSENSLQANSGLENPLQLTLKEDTKLYVTFLPMGTNAHLNETQDRQLRALAGGGFEGWEAATKEQANGLHRKAENYLNEYFEYNEQWGQPATVWWKDFQRKAPFGYDFLGEGTTWAGMHLQALALKYSVNPEDETTKRAMLRVLGALDRNSQIMGVPGRVARFSGPSSDSAYHWYYKNVRVGAFPGAAPWEHMTWLGKPTRDTHTGLFAGLAAIAALCKETPEVYRMAGDITERVVDRLLADDWKIKGTQEGYRALNGKDLKQLQMRTAYAFNPDKYKSFEKPIRDYRLKLKEGKSLYDKLYWVEWMTWARAMGIIILEGDAGKMPGYLEQVNAFFEKKVHHLNPYYTAVACYLNNLDNNETITPGLKEKAHALLEGLLLAYPDGPKWGREVDLFKDGKFAAKDEKHVTVAVFPNERVNADFNAQRSAARAKGGSNRQSYQYTNFDMYLAYWLGRAAGLMSPEDK